MFTADIPVDPKERSLGFSGSLYLNSKVFNTSLYINFTKWDLPVFPLLERNPLIGLRGFFGTEACNLKVILFRLRMSKTKEANGVHIFLNTKPYLANDTEKFFLLYDI